MNGQPKPKRPTMEAELHDAERRIDSLQHDLALCEGNPAAMNLVANWLRQQNQKASKRRQSLAQADAFAAHLRQLREKQKLTQVELAERAGIGQAMVSLLEQGDRQPSWPTICRLAKALDVSVESFQL